MKTNHSSSFEAVIRDAIVVQLSRPEFIDALTQSIVQRIDDTEDAMLAKILEKENDEESVDIQDFLKALKS